MRVTYNQTPPPVVAEEAGMVTVTPQLEQLNIIGFNGSEKGCVKLMVSQPRRLIFTIGSSLVVRDMDTGGQQIHVGHRYPVTCLTLSSSGHYLASGDTATLGVRALVNLWDTRSWSVVGSHQNHHAKVQSLAISDDDTKMVTLGGQDDKNVLVWCIATKTALFSQAVGTGKSGAGYLVTFPTSSCNTFMCGGKDLLQSWTIKDNKLTSYNISLGKLKRDITVAERDIVRDLVYLGTTSGDILKIALNSKSGGQPALVSACVRKPKKGQPSNAGRFSGGVTCLVLLTNNGDLLVGCGSGELVLVEQMEVKKQASGQATFPTQVADPTSAGFQEKRLVSLGGCVTSLLLTHSRTEALVATSNCQIYKVNLLTFNKSEVLTCPSSSIKSVCFPAVSTKLCAVGGNDGVQLWSDKGQLLLHVLSQTSGVSVTSVRLSHDGRHLVSGWSDNCVRLHTPETGKLVEEVRNCVTGKEGVTCLGLGRQVMLVGGADGCVTLWSLPTFSNAKLIKTVREHRGKVTSADMSENGKFAITTSCDGTGIVWNVPDMTRAHMLRGSAGLVAGKLHPNNVHALVLTSDNRLGYWDTVTGEEIRNIELSKKGTFTCMDLSPDGLYVAVGSDDSSVRVLRYNEATTVKIGSANCGSITSLKFGPDNATLATATQSGALVWTK